MHLKNSKVVVIKIGSSLLVDNKRKIRKGVRTAFAAATSRRRSPQANDNKNITTAMAINISVDTVSP